MNYIGIDLHKKSISICVVDQFRQVVSRKRFSCRKVDEIESFFREFRPFQGVVEATASRVTRMPTTTQADHRGQPPSARPGSLELRPWGGGGGDSDPWGLMTPA